jgi:hypothetical protein
MLLYVAGGAEGDKPLVSDFEPKAPANAALSSLQSYDGICRLKLLNSDGSARTLLTADLTHCKAMAEFRKVSAALCLSSLLCVCCD